MREKIADIYFGGYQLILANDTMKHNPPISFLIELNERCTKIMDTIHSHMSRAERGNITIFIAGVRSLLLLSVNDNDLDMYPYRELMMDSFGGCFIHLMQ